MTGDFQISRAGWIGDYEDPNTFLDTLRPNRGNNKTGWENAEYDALLKIANETIDVTKRYDYLMQAERLLISEMPIIPITPMFASTNYQAMLKAGIQIY